jgi:divalent metal cation (Fe/Co/Zn/Cd) transporter
VWQQSQSVRDHKDALRPKEILYWYTLKVAKTYKSDILKANAWHHRSDAAFHFVLGYQIVNFRLIFYRQLRD